MSGHPSTWFLLWFHTSTACACTPSRRGCSGSGQHAGLCGLYLLPIFSSHTLRGQPTSLGPDRRQKTLMNKAAVCTQPTSSQHLWSQNTSCQVSLARCASELEIFIICSPRPGLCDQHGTKPWPAHHRVFQQQQPEGHFVGIILCCGPECPMPCRVVTMASLASTH